MCGIFFCLCPSKKCCGDEDSSAAGTQSNNNFDVTQACLNDSLLEHRGPNVSKQYRLPLLSEWNCWMRGCVLHMRGQPTAQPLVDDKGNALLWNGEIFDGVQVPEDENDTRVLFNLLTNCKSDEDVLKTLEQVKGPWAFIFWQAERNMLWFGRDVYGRRSLLWHLPKDASDITVLASVAVGNLEYTEIPSVGIFSLDLTITADNSGLPQQNILPSMTLHPWYQSRWPGTRQLVMETQQQELSLFLTQSQLPSVIPITLDRKQILKYWIPDVCKTLSSSAGPGASSKQKEPATVFDDNDLVALLEKISKEDEKLRLLSERLIGVLQDAVMKRVDCLPDLEISSSCSENISESRVAILFSGGLDSSVIAAILDRCLPSNEPIDLLNVAFEQPRPKQSTRKTKQKRNKKKRNNFSDHQSSSATNHTDCLPSSDPTNNDTFDGISESQENFCVTYSHTNIELTESQSSTSHHSDGKETSENSFCKEFLNSKLLVNEQSRSFSKPSTSGVSSSRFASESAGDSFDPYDVPDRKTGRIAFTELNPNRRWNFIEINVSQEELQTSRSSRIGKLIYPLQTVLDDSIGCALWFAARGMGTKMDTDNILQHIVSKSKVILCGMAADEQFAGYSRHRVHFHQFGEESLMNQMEQEMWRISARNLGRDDRIIADHGKEARFPFLDEDFTAFVSKIPVHMRANLNLPRGVGDKLLLRLSALNLGLRQTACQPKRAIQFGSKIAKLDDSKEKGSDICQRLL